MTNLYRETAEPAVPAPPLDGDTRSDVIVVGGGFTGLSAALDLAQQDAKVVVLEAEEPGWGASGRNGGQVNPGLKHDPDVVERDFGADLGGRMRLPERLPLSFSISSSATALPAKHAATAPCGPPSARVTPQRSARR